MSFLNNIHTYGTLHSKLPAAKTDPIATMRENFKTNTRKQIKAITDMESLGRKGWYSTLPDGTLSVSLRNGIATMKLLGDGTHVVVSSSSAALDFYNDAINACSAGELDDLFMATRRASKKISQ
jgi:glucose/arabinose dehydrogenase